MDNPALVRMKEEHIRKTANVIGKAKALLRNKRIPNKIALEAVTPTILTNFSFKMTKLERARKTAPRTIVLLKKKASYKQRII